MSDKKTEKVAEKTAEKLASEVKKPEAKKVAYVVSEGKAITTKRGLLSEGKEIKAEWIGGGEDAFKKLIADKYIVKC